MSANGETSVVMKGITHGACDYLIKPIRLEELKTLWQHVARRKSKEATKQGAQTATNPNDSKNNVTEEVKWSAILHEKFVSIVSELGVESTYFEHMFVYCLLFIYNICLVILYTLT